MRDFLSRLMRLRRFPHNTAVMALLWRRLWGNEAAVAKLARNCLLVAIKWGGAPATSCCSRRSSLASTAQWL